MKSLMGTRSPSSNSTRTITNSSQSDSPSQIGAHWMTTRPPILDDAVVSLRIWQGHVYAGDTLAHQYAREGYDIIRNARASHPDYQKSLNDVWSWTIAGKDIIGVVAGARERFVQSRIRTPNPDIVSIEDLDTGYRAIVTFQDGSTADIIDNVLRHTGEEYTAHLRRNHQEWDRNR